MSRATVVYTHINNYLNNQVYLQTTNYIWVRNYYFWGSHYDEGLKNNVVDEAGFFKSNAF